VFVRCLAQSKNLDGDVLKGNITLHRCQEHTNAVVEELELGILWDEYGLVGDIIVCIASVLSFFYS